MTTEELEEELKETQLSLGSGASNKTNPNVVSNEIKIREEKLDQEENGVASSTTSGSVYDINIVLPAEDSIAGDDCSHDDCNGNDTEQKDGESVEESGPKQTLCILVVETETTVRLQHLEGVAATGGSSSKPVFV